MKIPLKWLSEYVDLKGLTDWEISDALTMSGTENEIVRGVDFPGIVVGEIKEISDHPDADRLHITKTDVGKSNGGVLQIVCGAPNIEVGQKVPVALIGTMIGEFEIAKAKIRGVESCGMLCSESELGISEDHSGIMILDPRSKVGDPLSSALNIGGTVLEAEITPNRSDCFSIIGVAGEAAASLNRKMKSRSFDKAKVLSKKKIDVVVSEKKLCPRYIAKVVEGVKIGPSPTWIQEKLDACGVRPINNVVDVTNYVMLEWGQPLHAFDMEKISGGIKVRLAKEGERIETLDGVERKLVKNDLVIADSKKAIGIAGVMGGANSEVGEKTTDIVLEAAVFESTSVRKTAQRLGLRTEASNRFEKGIPLGLPELAIERAAGILVEITDVKAKPKAGELTDVLSTWIWVQHVGLPQSRIKDFLGVEIRTDRVISILESLGFNAAEFDFKKEARKHIGKPYVFGASFKTHGDMAFDCSYLTDYIYSQIGKFIGHTCLGQFELGTPVKVEVLKPGDILFVKGHIEKSVTDYYYGIDENGQRVKINLEEPKEVGHCALYIGNGRIIHCRESVFDEKLKSWKKVSDGKVVEEDATIFTKNPQYLGARRYLDNSEGWISVDVPWWRLDVKIEEDILEEIGRIYGFENIPGHLPKGNLPVFEKNEMISLSDDLRNILAGAGFSEVYNYSFVSAKNISNIGDDPKGALRIANPISPDQEYMRTSLLSSLLLNGATNQFNFDEIKLFEIANIYLPNKAELPEERLELGIAVRIPGSDKGVAYANLKGVYDLLFEKLRIKRISYKELSSKYFTLSVSVLADTKEIGKILIPNSKTKQNFGLKTDIIVGTLDLNELMKKTGKTIKYLPISRFQQVVRDMNIVFDKKVKAEEIEQVLLRVKSDAYRSGFIKDIYEGQGLPIGEKSVTIRMVLGASDRTLTDAEIKEVQDLVVSLFSKTLGGKLRI